MKSGYVLVSTVMNNPTDSLIAVGITLLGLPIYLLLNRGQGDSSREQKVS